MDRPTLTVEDAAQRRRVEITDGNGQRQTAMLFAVGPPGVVKAGEPARWVRVRLASGAVLRLPIERATLL